MENGFDGGVLEYSLDGTTWFDILAGNGGAIERVVSVVAAIGEGATQDIALAMGIAPRVDGMTSEERRPYNALVAVLKRAAESGAVGWRWRIPGSPSAGRIYWRAA